MSDDNKVADFAAHRAAKAEASLEPSQAPGPRASKVSTVQDAFEAFMLQSETHGPFGVVVDLRMPGVDLPVKLRGLPFVMLSFGAKYHYPSWSLDAQGLATELSFGQGDEQDYQRVAFPWEAVRQIEGYGAEMVCAAGVVVRKVVATGAPDESGHQPHMRAYPELPAAMSRSWLTPPLENWKEDYQVQNLQARGYLPMADREMKADFSYQRAHDEQADAEGSTPYMLWEVEDGVYEALQYKGDTPYDAVEKYLNLLHSRMMLDHGEYCAVAVLTQDTFEYLQDKHLPENEGDVGAEKAYFDLMEDRALIFVVEYVESPRLIFTRLEKGEK